MSRVRAQYPGTCSRCECPIVPGALIVIRRHEWFHPGCVSGADE